MMAPVVLLTDFGEKDGFVGAMKGVILSKNPSAAIVDLSHEVSPFDVLEGALLLKSHYKYFPEGSVFVGVVDPGVGSERLPVVVETKSYIFVGPMNGLFDLVLRKEGKFRAYKIERFTL
ncbi:MAG: SAM-dependent chlorinase/fluorinase, partial [Aquificae bacterium]|nr:SAM-dependent chlorinase/fluorinase [Aquificota bacterium]